MEYTYNYPTKLIKSSSSTSSSSSSTSTRTIDDTKSQIFVKTDWKADILAPQDIAIETKGRFTVTTSQSSFYRPRLQRKQGRFIDSAFAM
jgi:hypothetical protein